MTEPLTDTILDILSDGEWHSIHEIDVRVPAKTSQMFTALQFLYEQKLIEVEKDLEGEFVRARLSKPMKKWYSKTERG